MTQQPAKRIPQWLTIDLLVIVVSLAIIGIFYSHRLSRPISAAACGLALRPVDR